MTTVLVSAPYMIPHIKRFRPILEHYGLEVKVVDGGERLTEELIFQHAGSYDATLCGDDRYTPLALQKCAPRLKVISKWGTGIDSIDQVAAAKVGIKVCNVPNAFTLPVSDSVMAYILAFARQQPLMDRMVKAGQWVKTPGWSLSERTLGVVGVGNIGKAVMRRAHAFGMQLLGNDIVPIATDFIAELGVKMLSLRELLETSDFVSLNCDLNSTSLHLINAETLQWVKQGAFLVNCARGPVIDEAALPDALRSGRLAGCGLDVFENEPLPDDSPLRQMDNVILAPHNSNASPAAWERVHWSAIRNLLTGLGIACDDLEALRRIEAKP